jgi:hypothetical protein
MDRQTGELAQENAAHMVPVWRLPMPGQFGEWITGNFSPVDDRQYPEVARWQKREDGNAGRTE